MDPYDDFLIGDMMCYMSYGMECLSEAEMERFGTLLPREVHHTPDEVKRISCLETLRATTENLKRWLKDGMEENRFGIPFVQTTKMIMDAVTTIGRGLVTLHVLGEDLSEAPMQIGELLDIAGFHFKKCSDGVRVSAGVNPTVCTRLFTCQLRWQNLIFRLYRTQARLEHSAPAAKPAVKRSAALSESSSISAAAEPPAGALTAAPAMSPLPVISSGSLPEETVIAAPGLSGNMEDRGARSAAIRPENGPAAEEKAAAGNTELSEPEDLQEQECGKDMDDMEVSPLLRDDELWEFFCRHTLPWSERKTALCTADTS